MTNLTKLNHTPEPWTVFNGPAVEGAETWSESYFGTIVRHGSHGGKRIADTSIGLSQDYAEGKANARRIVACVNACAGYTNEHLECVGVGGLHPTPEEQTKAGKLLERLISAEQRCDELKTQLACASHVNSQLSEQMNKLWDDRDRLLTINSNLQAKNAELAHLLGRCEIFISAIDPVNGRNILADIAKVEAVQS